MTKLKIDPDYEKGLSRKRDIDALKARRSDTPSRNGYPRWLTDGINLVVSASVGGACAWLGIKFFM